MEWQPIETAPRDGAAFLAAIKNDNSNNIRMSVLKQGRHALLFSDDGAEVDHWNWTVTHWMPLPPEPPTEGTE